MASNTRSWRVIALALALGAVAVPGPRAQQPEPYTKWDQHAGSVDSMQYSALKHINKSNVNGKLLWEHELEANPEGIPAVYQVNGREYIAFAAGASWGTGGDPVWRNPLHRKQGKIEAQGYHVFALPEPTK